MNSGYAYDHGLITVGSPVRVIGRDYYHVGTSSNIFVVVRRLLREEPYTRAGSSLPFSARFEMRPYHGQDGTFEYRFPSDAPIKLVDSGRNLP